MNSLCRFAFMAQSLRVPRVIPTAVEDDIDISLTYMRTTSS